MKKNVAIFLAFALVLTLGACAQDTEKSAGQEPFYAFTDSVGTNVELYARPQTAAVLFSSYAEIWTLSGGTVSITVGDSVERGFAEEGTPLVDGGAGQNIDTERLASLRPDFVIGSADTPAQADACARLRRMGMPCALFREETFEDYLGMLKIFTDINGREDLYGTLGTDGEEEIDEILEGARASAAALDSPVSVLFVRAGSGSSSTRAKTAENHFVGVMLKELGTFNIADEAEELSELLSLEHVLIHQPDIVLIVAQGNEEAAKAYMQSVLSEDGWRDLNAVRTGKVFYLPKDMFHYKPNARWADAYAYLASLIYPEAQA